ncbi:MAG TPA: hypothetical protein VGR06_19700 [Actinophytocola sp.]|uniref:hypothetical protein n=1 Tax=Actinophytocola sp. TaxID=1872138 RepID=UPI002DF952BC|nr:hypothetical protein [Actinophytocola sp.]
MIGVIGSGVAGGTGGALTNALKAAFGTLDVLKAAFRAGVDRPIVTSIPPASPATAPAKLTSLATTPDDTRGNDEQLPPTEPRPNEFPEERGSQLIVIQETVLQYVLTETAGTERQEVVTLQEGVGQLLNHHCREFLLANRLTQQRNGR